MGLIAGVGDFGLTELRDETLQYRNEAEIILESIENLEDIGILNASTGVATIESGNVTLTATPPTGWTNGQRLTVVTSGTLSFSGLNFTTGTTFVVGDYLVKFGSQFGRTPANSDNLKVITSSVSNPTETPSFKGQLGVYVDGSNNETFFIARSLTASNKWDKIYNPFSLLEFLNTNLYLKGSTFQKLLTSLVPTETPDYKGQLGTYTDGSNTDHWFVARSVGFTPKWERLVTSSSYFKTLTVLTDLPDYKGQYGVLGTNYYLAVSLSLGVANWQLIQTDVNGLKILSSSVTLPTEVPDFKGQIGVFTDGSTNQTFFVARSLTASNKWEKIHSDYTLLSYLNSNGYIKGATALKTLSGTISSIVETPDFKGQIGVLVISSVEYWFVARSTTGTPKWQLLVTDNMCFVNIAALTDIPAFKGQIGVLGGNQYLAVAFGSGVLNWKLLVTDTNALKVLTSSGTAPTETPDYKGQIGIFSSGGNNTYFVARSLTAAPIWEKLYNDYALNTYVTTNGILKGSTFHKIINAGLTTVPDFKGQIGYDPIEDWFLARSVGADYWVRLITDRNIVKYQSNDLLSKSVAVSQYDTEAYAHSAYVETFGRYNYVVYMANDVFNYEGATGQLIRMAKVDMLNPYNKTITEVARQGQTYGSVTIDNSALQVPNVLRIDEDTLRIFFRATVSGSNVMVFRDFTVSSQSLSVATIVTCYTKNNSTTLLQMNQQNCYEHYDWLYGATDALGSTHKDVFVTSDIRKMNDGNWYSCVSLGSGLDDRTTSIFMKSTNNGATWTLLASPNPLDLPGVIGTDYKYFWEAAIAEDTNNFYLFGRGNASGLASGVHKVVISKSDLYVCVGSGSSVFTKVWDYSNQKPCVFKHNNLGNFLITEGQNKLAGTLSSVRTSLDFIKISTDFNTYTKVFTLNDANGVHTPSVGIFKDTAYLTYSSSKRRLPQTRTIDEYQNTTEVNLVELNRKYFI